MLNVWLPLQDNLNNQGLSTVTITAGESAALYKNSKIGKGLDLSKRVTFNCPDLSGSTKLSVAFWVMLEDNSNITSNYQDVISFTDQKADNSGSGYLRAETCYGSTSTGVHWHDNTNYAMAYSSALPTHYVGDRGVWHHCVMTVDSTEKIRGYTDGVLVAEYGTNAPGGHLTGVFWLGENNNIAGCICDVRIYNHILSPREIKEISKGLVLHYPLNRGGFGQDNLYINSDTVFNSNGSKLSSTTINNGLIIDVNSPGGKYRSWDIVAENNVNRGIYYTYPTSNGSLNLTENEIYTVSFYARCSKSKNLMAAPVAESQTILNYDGNTYTSVSNNIIVGTTWKRHYVTFRYTSTTKITTCFYLRALDENVTFDIALPKLEKGSIATPWTPELIGQNNLFDFSSIASKWTAENCTVSDYADSKYGNVLQMTTTSANQRIYRNVTGTIWEADTTYTVSFLARATTPIQCNMSRSIANFSPTFNLTTEWRRYTGVINSTVTVSGGTLSFRVLTAGTVYITGITLEKGDTTSSYQGVDNIEYDVSGYGRNGMYNGVVSYTSDTAKYNVSTVFNGTDTFIEANSLPSETKTISFWIKPSSSRTSYLAFADYGSQLCFGLENNDHFNTMTTNARGTTFSKSAVTQNAWNHVVIVKTGDTTRKLYVNGVEQQGLSTNFWTHNVDCLTIGIRETQDTSLSKQYYLGNISDFRAYTTALSADDVLELYHTPITLSNNGTLMTQGSLQEV